MIDRVGSILQISFHEKLILPHRTVFTVSFVHADIGETNYLKLIPVNNKDIEETFFSSNSVEPNINMKQVIKCSLTVHLLIIKHLLTINGVANSVPSILTAYSQFE